MPVYTLDAVVSSLFTTIDRDVWDAPHHGVVNVLRVRAMLRRALAHLRDDHIVAPPLPSCIRHRLLCPLPCRARAGLRPRQPPLPRLHQLRPWPQWLHPPSPHTHRRIARTMGGSAHHWRSGLPRVAEMLSTRATPRLPSPTPVKATDPPCWGLGFGSAPFATMAARHNMPPFYNDGGETSPPPSVVPLLDRGLLT